MLTRDRKNDLSTPSSSNRLSSVAARNSSRSLWIRVAVIRVEDQRLLPAFTDPLSQASPAHKFCCDGGIFSLGDIPGHHFAAPDIDHQVEVELDPAHGGGEIGDVPTPELVRSDSPEPWHGSWFLW